MMVHNYHEYTPNFTFYTLNIYKKYFSIVSKARKFLNKRNKNYSFYNNVKCILS